MINLVNRLIRYCALVLGFFVSVFVNCAFAETKSSDPLKYVTVGVWADAPLGLAGRAGLALPLDKESALTVGGEIGTGGNKQFVGWRTLIATHGVAWGGVDIVHWRTNSHAIGADNRQDYYGIEGQLLFFRAGAMFPKGGDGHPTLTLGVGLSF